jgi:hypothetical protein
METAVNATEEFVYHICKNSFLSTWSYPNPRGKEAGKELCDILVVCEPHIVIVSVKDVQYKDTGRAKVDRKRWERKAIDGSVKQILGAQRFLDNASHVVKRDGTKGLPLPASAHRKYHRIAVAFGADRKVGLSLTRGKPFTNNFVHVVDERACLTLLKHLDTISDFTKYLDDKEKLFSKGVRVSMAGGEEDLLAVYLNRGRRFPKGDFLILQEDLWETFSKKPEFSAKLREDEDSYVWDRLIELLAVKPEAEAWEFVGSLTELELAVRTMAREHRFSRRLLGKALKEFIEQANAGILRSRCTKSLRGVIYVFMMSNLKEENKHRIAELGCRCYAALAKFPDAKTIVGVDITRSTGTNVKRATNICYFHSNRWPEEFLVKAKQCQQDLGFFVGNLVNQEHCDEYPAGQ